MWVGVKTVVVPLEDGVLVERQAPKSNVVFACVHSLTWGGWVLLMMSIWADSDHVGAGGGGGEAILRGLKKRHRVTDTVPVLVYIVRRFARCLDPLADPAGIFF